MKQAEYGKTEQSVTRSIDLPSMSTESCCEIIHDKDFVYGTEAIQDLSARDIRKEKKRENYK